MFVHIDDRWAPASRVWLVEAEHYVNLGLMLG